MRFTMPKLLMLSLCLAALPAAADTLILEPVADATLIETPDGGLANGIGPGLFAGRNNQPEGRSLRRALLHFDLGALPSRARIESVSLRLNVQQSQPNPATVSLHRVLRGWSEGPAFSNGGAGAPAQPGDATWLHANYPDASWPQPGGHYVARASASIEAPGGGPFTLTDVRMLRDLRVWQANPAHNFGWILVGSEEQPQSVRRLHSRESMFADRRPRLVVEYSLP